jgi:hypothetical protein
MYLHPHIAINFCFAERLNAAEAVESLLRLPADEQRRVQAPTVPMAAN